MAKKKKAAVAASKAGTCSCVCENDEHAKMAGGFKLVTGLVVLAFAAGVLSLNLTAWIAGALVALAGIKILAKQ